MASTGLKKGRLKESRLYLIIDKKIAGKKPNSNIAAKLKSAGVDIIQLRDKNSKRETIFDDALLLKKLLLNTKTLFIINDYLDIAKITDSDGIHLGQKDTSIEITRKILGKDKIIGVSCHNLKQALRAQENGADYISIGPVFPTATKPHYKAIGTVLIKKLRKEIKIPFFAVGGVNLNNINQVLISGAKRVAVCRAILQAKNIRLAVKEFNKLLN